MGKVTIADEMDAIKTALEALEPLNHDQRKFAVRMIGERLQVASGTAPLSLTGGSASLQSGAGAASNSTAGSQTAKQFLLAKRPKTDVQRVACLGYYLTHERDTPHFKTKDLTLLNTEAAQPRLSNAADAVSNATMLSQFLVPAGGGKKQISPLGEAVVAALPDQEAVKKAIAEHPRRKPRARRPKAKKAEAK